MRYSILVLLMFSACGQAPGTSGPCESDPSLGSGWVGVNDHAALELTADCKGLDSSCGAFTWTEPGKDKHSTITVAADPTNLTDCPSAGTHDCSVWRDFYGKQERLHLACDGQWFRDYTRGTP